MPSSWNTMKEYDKDDEFKWINPKKVNTNDTSFWKTITVRAEIEFYLLKRKQLFLGQSKHKQSPFTTEAMKQKFNWMHQMKK